MRYRFVAIILVFLTTWPVIAAEPGMSVAELINKHLASIGTPEQRAAAKTRVATGKSHYKIVVGGAGEMDGAVTLVASENNLRLVMKYSDAKYRGEDLLTDGDRVQVYGSPKRSLLGQFLYDESALLTEGLLGGTLTTAWPLLDPKVHSARISYEGVKAVDGTDLHEVKYVPKKRGDLEIRLYFDKETFRHVLTVATVTIDPRLVGGETMTARQQQVRYRFEQRFKDFRQVDGLMLPQVHSIRFSAEGYGSAILTYDNTFDDITQNVTLDPRNFQIK